MSQTSERPAHRFWVDFALSVGAEVELPERVMRHVAVLRLREGDELTLFDGRGGEYRTRLERLRQGHAAVRVLAWDGVERESTVDITLALGVSSAERMDYAVQKATELGVTQIVPVDTARCVVRLSSQRAERRLAHWHGIAVAACEQCGRNRVPSIRPVTGLADFLRTDAHGMRVLLALDGQRRLRDVQPASAFTVLIGPEGGLTEDERSRAVRAGFAAIRFGPRVLRTETAPLAVIAALQSLWGDC
ncbi:MAG: 16S rRNA (uracil(1498)-N(3))-methyltransferase [Betaproteobacteria bacterium RBG_16_64_9]|nr:MAG: 16S rRNA (uracil(1498)-N(3))-methyltransferase [Betaproteobacteria bacterium RBG_16_64_9]OGA21966.1 MAG: 16S rRNA (uracil(1498)-N(3))-methyltransferase [Betaproteobacteria bacterium RIFCSPLOWO2_02_FULL_65_24]OGA92376.1 MAG: 16S rRNA (uracil(1498)-N(3))-methyltransferase [Betaproteobacteria bacterium RIFCSPLOWO2_12_FULL_66_14]